jgi:CRP/FNR family cyclic AMP-dependent transcriptional regulator
VNTAEHSGFERSALAYGLKPEHATAVRALAHEVEFRGGEEIFRHRAGCCDLYVILTGTVNLVTDDGDKLFEAGPGTVIGEIAFLDACVRDANATAVTPVTALKFPAADLRRKMCQDKELGFAVLANLARVVCAKFRNAEDRLDHLMDTAHGAWTEWDR